MGRCARGAEARDRVYRDGAQVGAAGQVDAAARPRGSSVRSATNHTRGMIVA
jgi:hypothetical protein